MPLMRFFKPKWQHPNPEVRRQAVQTLTIDDAETLKQVATRDDDAQVRRVALGRLQDLQVLRKAMEEETDTAVREFARDRLGELLAGVIQTDHPLERRLELLKHQPEPRLLAYVALHGTEPELRSSVQGLVQQQEVLGEVAIKDPVVANRMAAMERIDAPDVLEKVFRETRKNDKRINRLARGKLDAQQAERERIAALHSECEALCSGLERMGKGSDWEAELSEFEALEARWAKVSEAAEAEYRQRYAQARDAFVSASAAFREAREARLREWATAREAKQAILSQLTKRSTELAELQELDEAQETQTLAELQAWQAAWDELAENQDPQAKPLHEAYRADLAALRARLNKLKDRRLTSAALEKLLGEARKLLANQQPISESQVKSLERRWEAKEAGAEQEAYAVAKGSYVELHKQLKARLVHQIEKRKKEFEKLPEMLDNLESSLQEQLSKEAVPLHDKLQSTLSQLETMGTAKDKLAPFAKRLHRLTPQVRELQSWRTWGADEARERLCEEMEALIGSEEKPADLATKIRHLRGEWNRLRTDGGFTAKTLRKRFDQAANEAYKPCEDFFKQQSEQRGQNQQKKLQLLEQLDAYLETVEWSHIDWKAAVKFQRQMSNDWRQAGPVDRRESKELDTRYQKAMGVLNEHLELEHKRNLAQRKSLIEQVRALVETPDISQAIDECKQLQTQWQTTVPGKRKLENEIWQEFREACDAVFARRKQEQDARQAEEQQNKSSKEEICTKIEQLAQVEIAELDRAERSLHKLLDEWKEIGFVSKRDVSGLEHRLDRAQEAFHRHKAELLAAQEQAQLKLLQTKAQLCAQLEQSLEDEASTLEPDSIEASWKQLEKLSNGDTEKLIAERFTKALEAAKDEEGHKPKQLLQELQANLPARQELCLRMEILCGVESPPELQQARMEFQANRLAEAMGLGEADPVGKIADLELSWWLTGCAPASEEARLQQRFDKARRANETKVG